MIAPIKQRLGLSTPLTLGQREALQGFIYISPWIIGFLVFTVGPMIASAYLSLTDYNIVTPPRFAGLSNYEYMFGDRLFWKSIENTLYYTVIFVPIAIAGSLALAMLLNQQDRGKGRFAHAVFSAVGDAGGGGRLPLAVDLPAADRADEQHHLGAGAWAMVRSGWGIPAPPSRR